MITLYTSFLIPASVVDGKFPKADEDKLKAMSVHWTSVGTTLGGQSDSTTAVSRTVFANWSGSGADTASAQITAVTRFTTGTASATTVMSAGCAKAAAFVTNTKNGINAVLRQLENMTKQQVAIGVTNPLMIPVCIRNVMDLRAQALAIVAAYSAALTSAMGGIPFAFSIEPRPNHAAITATTPTNATTSTGSTTSGASGSATPSGTTGTGGASPTGSTASTPTAPAAPSGSADVWSGDLTDYQDVGSIDDLFAVPAAGAGSQVDGGSNGTPGIGSVTTDAGHHPQSGTPSPSTSTGSETTIGTTGTTTGTTVAFASDNAADLWGKDNSAGTTTTPTPGSSPGTVPTNVPGGKPPTVAIDTHDVGAVVQGDASSSSVTLSQPANTPTPAGNHPGAGGNHPAPSGVDGSVPPTTTPQATAPASEPRSQPLSLQPSSGGHTASPTGGYSGGQTTGTTGGGVPVVNQPIGTGAAGSTAVEPYVATPITTAPPIIAPPASSAFVGGGGGSPGAVTNIQIGPGGSGPVTNLGGGVGIAAPATTGALTGFNAGPVTTGGAVPPSSLAGPGANAAAPAGQASSVPGPQAGPPVSAAQPLRIPAGQVGPGAVTSTGTEGSDAAVVPVAVAIAALGLVGTAARHFAGLWQDLGASSVLRSAGAILPTQFGHDDELVAALPAGLDTVYQKVLLPGEVDQLFAGQVETLRGLVHPYHAVRDLRTPAQLYDALGLGFAITGMAGSDTLAFNRDAESVEVLRCAGLRPDDLVTPVDADVMLPPGTVPVPLVRHHKRPWSGTGEAPGSTSDTIIDEHEVLGYASVAIPHLAEIWRLHADGREEYVSTYNQRNGQWLGDTTPSHQPIGRRIDNGAYAALGDGTVYRTVLLTDRHSVLVAYGVSAPEHFEQAHDGSYRITVANTDLVSLMGVTTIGTWQGSPVQLLHRQGSMLLVDYAGDDVVGAAAAGFVQVSQGQWQPRWVEHTEVSDVQELERPYALPRPAPGTTVSAPDPGEPEHADGQVSATVASGART